MRRRKRRPIWKTNRREFRQQHRGEKLRSEVADARSAAETAKEEADKAKKAAAKADAIAKDNKELQNKLATADSRVKDLEKQISAKAASVPGGSCGVEEVALPARRRTRSPRQREG